MIDFGCFNIPDPLYVDQPIRKEVKAKEEKT
jgi:hypothetical protein